MKLAAALGPVPDENWLNYVLTDETGDQYAVLEGSQLIAVVGVLFPTVQNPYYVITDIAVRPERRDIGVGSRVLGQLTSTQLAGNYWRAYVDTANANAKRFFLGNGWTGDLATPDDDGMIELRCEPR